MKNTKNLLFYTLASTLLFSINVIANDIRIDDGQPSASRRLSGQITTTPEKVIKKIEGNSITFVDFKTDTYQLFQKHLCDFQTEINKRLDGTDTPKTKFTNILQDKALFNAIDLEFNVHHGYHFIDRQRVSYFDYTTKQLITNFKKDIYTYLEDLNKKVLSTIEINAVKGNIVSIYDKFITKFNQFNEEYCQQQQKILGYICRLWDDEFTNYSNWVLDNVYTVNSIKKAQEFDFNLDQMMLDRLTCLSDMEEKVITSVRKKITEYLNIKVEKINNNRKHNISEFASVLQSEWLAKYTTWFKVNMKQHKFLTNEEKSLTFSPITDSWLEMILGKLSKAEQGAGKDTFSRKQWLENEFNALISAKINIQERTLESRVKSYNNRITVRLSKWFQSLPGRFVSLFVRGK